jgi:translation initiation factor IF-2
MAKKTASDLAKEISRDLKDVKAAVEKVLRIKVTARTSLSEEEELKVRDAMGLSKRPEVRIGEQRVSVEETDAGRAVVTDVRTSNTVIRRRRVKEPTEEAVARPFAPDGEGWAAGPPAPAELIGEDMPSFEPTFDDAPLVPEPAAVEPVVQVRAAPAPPPPPPPPPPPAAERVEARVERELPPALPPAPGFEQPMGARVLGRIDLKKAEPTRPSTTSADPRRRVDAGAVAGAPATPPAEEEASADKKRKKLKVIKKDVLETERYFRGSRLPKKKRALPGKEQKKTEITVPKAAKRVIRISDVISVGDLAKGMGVKSGEVLRKLMDMGMMATITQLLDLDTATLVANDFEYTIENVAYDAESAVEVGHDETTDDEAKESRPPVVTIMGHVDHGKTSLLDAIRKTRVAEGEAGGITQHIGAYSVSLGDRGITFVDTPGHEAFTAMRARGAKVTDIVILVVAADDGVMPQTVEAINHARAAGVPIVVAVNKIDKPDANLERTKRSLADHGLAAEDWGGDTVVQPVSAKTQQGIPELLEMVLLQADLLELRATTQKLARGVIIESKLERGRGPVATVLVQEGTLKAGDPFVCGVQWGRVRAMMDENGRRIEIAGPSTPVEVLGLQGVPDAGDVFTVVADENTARTVAEHRIEKKRQTQLATTAKVSLEDLYQKIKTGEAKELRVILKGDVHGSVEAVQEALGRLSSDQVRLTVLHASVGGVSESDVLLASASDAIIIAFNVRPEAKASELGEREGVEIRAYTIIYEVLKDVRAALEGLLEPEYREKVLGRAEVRQPFTIPGVGTIAGSFVSDGKITRGSRARLLRDNVVVYDGKIGSLRRFKEDAREVAAGYECGLGLENFNDVKISDVVESYELEQVARRLVIPAQSRSGAQAERHA